MKIAPSTTVRVTGLSKAWTEVLIAAQYKKGALAVYVRGNCIILKLAHPLSVRYLLQVTLITDIKGFLLFFNFTPIASQNDSKSYRWESFLKRKYQIAEKVVSGVKEHVQSMFNPKEILTIFSLKNQRVTLVSLDLDHPYTHYVPFRLDWKSIITYASMVVLNL